jgi:hypothetical protein
MRRELSLQIVPLKNADHKRVSRHKNNPLQRIKVSDRTSLLTIAGYIRRLAGAEADGAPVALYASYRGEPLQVPLSMSVGQYLIVTNQDGHGEVRYAFADARPGAGAPAARPRPRQEPLPELPRYPPPPLLGRARPLAPPPLHPADSFAAIFHSGFSLLSNSFGGFLPSIDAGPPGQAADGKVDDAISLRQNLEIEIQRK